MCVLMEELVIDVRRMCCCDRYLRLRVNRVTYVLIVPARKAFACLTVITCLCVYLVSQVKDQSTKKKTRNAAHIATVLLSTVNHFLTP